MITIYALVDPRYGEVRYVGKTGQRLNARLNNHCAYARSAVRTHRDAWIRSLLDLGLRPRISILEQATTENWMEAERRWISYHQNLTNHSQGGEGACEGGWSHSEQTRQKIRCSLIKYQESIRSDKCARGHQITGFKIRANGRPRRYCKECNNMSNRTIHNPGPSPVS